MSLARCMPSVYTLIPHVAVVTGMGNQSQESLAGRET
jgi:hypothetical protein